LWAQIIPVQNSEEELLLLNVKSLSTFNIPQNGDSARLIFKKEFDPAGKLMKEYQLSLWGAVSISNTTSYSYNEKRLLSEESNIEEILNLFERDQYYIESFGSTPMFRKTTFSYNDDDLIIEKITERTGEQIPLANKSTITYQYEKGFLISEKQETNKNEFFDVNYFIEYVYDSMGNLTQENRDYGDSLTFHSTLIYVFDENSRLIEKQSVDSSIARNTIRLKYEYNNDNQLINTYFFNIETNEFELENSYQYDEKGNMISGDREVKFEYYENGLIKSESWADSATDEVFELTTTYEFF